MNKIPLIAIIGPTAVGKTAFSLPLAKELGAEVISVDSRQVYRYLDVGTDKVDRDTMRDVIHHLINIADPDEIYSAADFVKDATSAISRITARGRVPLLIGGTAFYYKALCGALSEGLPSDPDVRAELKAEAEQKGTGALHSELVEIDPAAAARIHPNDPVRTMRALEIYRITGKNATWWYNNQNKLSSQYDIFYIGLTRDRANLYRNIEIRVKCQFASGYPEEVQWLLSHGYSPELPALQGFGYRELVQYLRNECTLAEAILGDIRSTKAFSRRQMTWFKHFEPAVWYDMDKLAPQEALIDVIPKCLAHLAGEDNR